MDASYIVWITSHFSISNFLTFPLYPNNYSDFKCLNLDAKKLEYSQIKFNLENNEATGFSVNNFAPGLVVKSLDSQFRCPAFKTTGWLQGRLSLSSFQGQ